MIWKFKNGKWTAYQGSYYFVVERVSEGFIVKYQDLRVGGWDEIGNVTRDFVPWNSAAEAMERAEMFARLIGAL